MEINGTSNFKAEYTGSFTGYSQSYAQILWISDSSHNSEI